VSREFQLGSEQVWALRDVDLRIEPQEFVALIGRSGSGKTTLLNILAGLDRPSAGEVWFDERRIDTLPEQDLTMLRRRDIGFIFQSFGLLPLLSAYENVELPLRIAGFKHGDRSRMAREALEVVGLTRRASHRPYELSGGEQQRVAIARAIATRPRAILADEPTGELDSTTARLVFDLLRVLAREHHITVVTCTHDRLVMEMADRVEELSDGRIVEAGQRQLWARVQQAERSPFAAVGTDTAAGEGGLSSLAGADPSLFGRPATTEPGAITEPVLKEAEPSGDEDSRWARPRRGD